MKLGSNAWCMISKILFMQNLNIIENYVSSKNLNEIVGFFLEILALIDFINI